MGRLVGLGFVVLFLSTAFAQSLRFFLLRVENDLISFRWFILLIVVLNIEAQKKPSISKFLSTFDVIFPKCGHLIAV